MATKTKDLAAKTAEMAEATGEMATATKLDADASLRLARLGQLAYQPAP
jgi:hypothetical protein